MYINKQVNNTRLFIKFLITSKEQTIINWHKKWSDLSFYTAQKSRSVCILILQIDKWKGRNFK